MNRCFLGAVLTTVLAIGQAAQAQASDFLPSQGPALPWRPCLHNHTNTVDLP